MLGIDNSFRALYLQPAGGAYVAGEVVEVAVGQLALDGPAQLQQVLVGQQFRRLRQALETEDIDLHYHHV